MKERTEYDDYISNLTIERVKQIAISELIEATNQLYNAMIENDNKEFRKVVHMMKKMCLSLEDRLEKE